MLLIVAVAGLMAAYAFHRDFFALYEHYCERGAEVQASREELRAAKALEEELARKVEQLGGDPVEMEAAIRRNKNLIREGETIYRVELPPEIESGSAMRSQ